MTREVLASARRHLATEGAAGLSLRAVARDLGMVSSAIYRYVPSRDALLTALIVEGYDSLGEAVEQAGAGRRRSDVRGRWRAVCLAARSWARDRPQEWALLFGSPVPEYAAPHDTIGPATRLPRALIGVVVDAHLRERIAEPARRPVSRRVRALVAPLRAEIGADVADETVVRSLMAWSYLVGTISFELGGHFVGSVTDVDAWFAEQVERVAEFVGIS